MTRRPLRNLSISPTAAPIALTSILSQDGRGGKKGMGSRLRGSKRGARGKGRGGEKDRPAPPDSSSRGLLRMTGGVRGLMYEGGKAAPRCPAGVPAFAGITIIQRGEGNHKGLPLRRVHGWNRGFTPISIFPHQGGRGGREGRRVLCCW